MIDLKFLRENPDAVRESQRARGEDPGLVDQLLAADEVRRSSIQAADELRAEQKAFGKKIGQAAPEERPALLEGSNELKEKVKAAENGYAIHQRAVDMLADRGISLSPHRLEDYRDEVRKARRRANARRAA